MVLGRLNEADGSNSYENRAAEPLSSREQFVGNGEAERFSGLQGEDELEFGRLLN